MLHPAFRVIDPDQELVEVHTIQHHANGALAPMKRCKGRTANALPLAHSDDVPYLSPGIAVSIQRFEGLVNHIDRGHRF